MSNSGSRRRSGGKILGFPDRKPRQTMRHLILLLLVSLLLLPSWARAGRPLPSPRPRAKVSQPDKPPSSQSQQDPPKATQQTKTPATWSPAPPSGPKPSLADEKAAEWRYQRYLHDQAAAGKSPSEVLSPEKWKSLYFDPVKSGGRPGRPGGPAQVATRKALTEEEGYINTESKRLGDKFVDMYKPNALGGTDYVEVDGILRNGLPTANMHEKLKAELRALGHDDTLLIVDKQNPSRRIRYLSGESPDVVDTRRAGSE